MLELLVPVVLFQSCWESVGGPTRLEINTPRWLVPQQTVGTSLQMPWFSSRRMDFPGCISIGTIQCVGRVIVPKVPPVIGQI